MIFVRLLTARGGCGPRRPPRTGVGRFAGVATPALCVAFATGAHFGWAMPSAASGAGTWSVAHARSEIGTGKGNDDGSKGETEQKQAKTKDRKKGNGRADDVQEPGTAGKADGEDEGGRPGKVGVCHATGSASNPYRYVEVGERAIPAHQGHGDIIGVESADACPTAAGVACPSKDDGDASAAAGVAEEATPGPTEDPAGDTVDGPTAAAARAGDLTGHAGAARGSCPSGGGRGAQDDADRAEADGSQTDAAATTGEVQVG